MAFEMTGIVTDQEGTPVPGATVMAWEDYSGPSVLTDESGRYKLSFTGVPGSIKGPAGTEEAVAFIHVEASGYERYARYLLGTTQHLVENVQLRRIKRITTGESAVLTIAPDDTVCVLDGLPGRDLVCGIVRVVVPASGILSIGAVPQQAGSAIPMLRAFGGGTGGWGNPTSFRVTAGTEYTVTVEVPWGFTGSQSFVVNATMALP